MMHLFGLLLFLVLCTSVARSQDLDPLITVSWKSIGSLTSARTNVGAVYIGDGRILVMGGSTGHPTMTDPMAIPQSTCEIVDVWNRRIDRAESMNVARSEFVALQASDSSVIVIGGVTGRDPYGAVTGTVERYDRATGAWTVLGSLATPRRQHVAGFIDSTRILVIGGRLANYGTLMDAEIFDTRTGTSTATTAFPYPVNGSVLMSSHSGELVLLGGRSGGVNSKRRSDVYSYMPATREWVMSRVLGQAVTGVAALRLLDRRVIVAGGLHQDEPGVAADEVQLENIGKWKLIARMSRGRAGAAMAQWSENAVLAIGGHYNNWQPIRTSEWIDLNRRTCRSGPELNVSRARFAALSIHSARDAEAHHHTIVAIGGMSSWTELTATIEILEPAR